MRVDARPFEDVESPGKLVLMNVRRPVEPKQNLDVKPRVVMDDELGLAKSRLRLKRLLIVEQELPHQRGEIHVLRGRPFLKRVPGAKGPATQKEGAMLVAPEAGRAPSQVAAASVRKEYQLPASTTALEVIVVHREALKAAGWRIVDENIGVKTTEPNVTAHFAKGAVDLWAHVTARGDRYTVTVGTS